MPGLGRSPGEEKGYPLQYSGLENPMDYTVLGVRESDTTERPSWPIFMLPATLHLYNDSLPLFSARPLCLPPPVWARP